MYQFKATGSEGGWKALFSSSVLQSSLRLIPHPRSSTSVSQNFLNGIHESPDYQCDGDQAQRYGLDGIGLKLGVEDVGVEHDEDLEMVEAGMFCLLHLCLRI